MPAIARKTQSIFGSSLTPAGNLAVWGSLAAGSPAYSGDPVTLQSLPAWPAGLASEVIGNRSPSLEDLNALFYVLTYQIAYLLERGIAEWDSTGNTNYYANDCARVGQVTYQVKPGVSGAVGATSPASDTNNWATFASGLKGPNMLSASVTFDGRGSIGSNCTILRGFNVATVLKVGVGQYLLTFTNAMSVDGSGNGIYTFAGSCGPQNGVASIDGDNNLVTGFPGTYNSGTGLKTATQCLVGTWEAATRGPSASYAPFGFEDSSSVSVEFTG